MPNLKLFRSYYYLTKPGIIYGNLVTATAGFLLAARGHVSLGLLLALIFGMGMVIASACVFNNYLDREFDAKMARTKRRALVTGKITPQAALVFASLLGFAGFVMLIFLTNWLTVLVGAIGFIDYVFFYTFSKRHTPLATLIGSLAGATPPVAGYVTVTHRFDTIAALLLVILVFWQMAHFFAIALYRRDDYAHAGLPVLPVIKGVKVAKRQIVAYIVAFMLACAWLDRVAQLGIPFLVVTMALGLSWLILAWQGWQTYELKLWARRLFFWSLVVNLGFCVLLATVASLGH